MGTPQILILFLIAVDVAYVMAKHGQHRDPYNGGTNFLANLVFLLLLIWGDFF